MSDDTKRPETRDSVSPQGSADGEPPAIEAGDTAQASIVPPGEQLKQARIAARLSEQEVARELCMTVFKVRLLEADDYERLHSDTFVRGYLRTYAKLLGVDPAIVLDAYAETRRAAGLDAADEENLIQVKRPESGRPVWRFALLIVVLLVGLWALSVWFLGNEQAITADPALVDPMVEITSLQAATDEPEPEAGEAQPSPGPSNEPVAAEPSTMQSADEADAAAGVSGEDSVDTVRAGPEVEALTLTDTRTQTRYTEPEVLDQLRLEFEEECWVEVIDSRGDVLQANLLQPGSVLNLSGEAPFDVKLGNANAVRMALNGDPYAFTVPDNRRTLTLTVN